MSLLMSRHESPASDLTASFLQMRARRRPIWSPNADASVASAFSDRCCDRAEPEEPVIGEMLSALWMRISMERSNLGCRLMDLE
jgi:hypothetical protein